MQIINSLKRCEKVKVLRYYKGAGLHRQINPRPDLNKKIMRKDKCLINLLHGFGINTLYSQKEIKVNAKRNKIENARALDPF